MRIVISGTHRVGKSTLIEALAEALPRHEVVDEPYRLLEDDGHEFSDPPTVEDFEAQLARSFVALEDEDGADVIFDRGPVDLVAYLMALGEDHGWHDRVAAAVATLDLIVLVPIEEPDRIAVARHEDLDLRASVDAHLRALLAELDVAVVEVHGDVAARVAQVLSHVPRR